MSLLPKAGSKPAQWWRLSVHAWVSVLLLALLWGLYWVSMPVSTANTVAVTTARASLPGQPATSVALPHVLDDQPPPWWTAPVSYQLDWPAHLTYAQASQARLALLLPRVGTRFRVLVNGHEVYQVGWYAQPEKTVNAAWFPYFIPLPAALLAPEASANRVEVQVRAQLLERSGLWPLQLGSHDEVYKRYRILYGWQVNGTWMMFITALLMGFISIFLWMVMRERLFGLMAAASFAHSVRLLLSVLLEPQLSFEAYFLLHRIAFTVYCGFLYLFIEELFGFRLKLSRFLSRSLLVLGPVWMFVTLWTQDYDLYRAWAGVLLIVALIVIGQVLYRSRGGLKMNSDQMLVMIVTGFTFATGLRDFLVVQMGWQGDADIRWMSLGSLALMFTMGWVLVKRVTASAREVHRLNDSLAEKIAKREDELRSAFEQLRESERQRAIEHERRRLMRDMHDGLGSHLVQTLNMVRGANQELDRQGLLTMLQHALEELRITLDSLEPMEGDLPTILGTLRQRIGPALAAGQIALDWQVEEVPSIPTLDAKGVMHLFRCVQEIFANTAKHSRANLITVRTWSQGDEVHLTVSDNGVGPSHLAVHPTGGRGLDNICVRAAKMGAIVRFFDAMPGFGVELVFGLRSDLGLQSGFVHTDFQPL